MTQRRAARKSSARRPAARKPAVRRSGRRWSGEVTRHSDALDLARGVFTWKNPKRIAGSLKRSAQRSKRRKADPYRSALSMLTFYLNRAGKTQLFGFLVGQLMKETRGKANAEMANSILRELLGG